jgi:hypothetical protein
MVVDGRSSNLIHPERGNATVQVVPVGIDPEPVGEVRIS